LTIFFLPPYYYMLILLYVEFPKIGTIYYFMRQELRIFKALSDWNRLRILKMLEVKPLCGCDIANVLDIVQSAVSRHLKILEDAELITHKRDGNYILYSLNNLHGSAIVISQLELLRSLNKDPVITADRRKAATVDKCGTIRK